MRAHISSIISMAVSGSTVITASSAGGIKVRQHIRVSKERI
jgi:hypothetical protein